MALFTPSAGTDIISDAAPPEKSFWEKIAPELDRTLISGGIGGVAGAIPGAIGGATVGAAAGGVGALPGAATGALAGFLRGFVTAAGSDVAGQMAGKAVTEFTGNEDLGFVADLLVGGMTMGPMARLTAVKVSPDRWGKIMGEDPARITRLQGALLESGYPAQHIPQTEMGLNEVIRKSLSKFGSADPAEDLGARKLFQYLAEMPELQTEAAKVGPTRLFLSNFITSPENTLLRGGTAFDGLVDGFRSIGQMERQMNSSYYHLEKDTRALFDKLLETDEGRKKAMEAVALAERSTAKGGLGNLELIGPKENRVKVIGDFIDKRLADPTVDEAEKELLGLAKHYRLVKSFQDDIKLTGGLSSMDPLKPNYMMNFHSGSKPVPTIESTPGRETAVAAQAKRLKPVAMDKNGIEDPVDAARYAAELAQIEAKVDDSIAAMPKLLRNAYGDPAAEPFYIRMDTKAQAQAAARANQKWEKFEALDQEYKVLEDFVARGVPLPKGPAYKHMDLEVASNEMKFLKEQMDELGKYGITKDELRAASSATDATYNMRTQKALAGSALFQHVDSPYNMSMDRLKGEIDITTKRISERAAVVKELEAKAGIDEKVRLDYNKVMGLIEEGNLSPREAYELRRLRLQQQVDTSALSELNKARNESILHPVDMFAAAHNELMQAVAMQKAFGDGGIGAIKLMDLVKASGNEKAHTFLLDMFNQLTRRDTEQAMVHRVLGDIRGYLSAGQLTFSSIPNMFQSLGTSMVSPGGWGTVFKSLFNTLLKNEETTKKIILSNLTNEKVNQIITHNYVGQYQTQGAQVASKVHKWTGFTLTEHFNRLVAVRAAVQDLENLGAKLAANPNSLKPFEILQFKRLGIDPREVVARGASDPEILKKIMYNMERKSQFFSGVLDLPLFAQTDVGRTLYQYKGFAINTAKMMSDVTLDAWRAAKAGDLSGFAKLYQYGLAAPSVGTAINAALDTLKGLDPKTPDSTVEAYLRPFMAAMGLGLWNSILSSLISDNPTNLQRLLSPPVLTVATDTFAATKEAFSKGEPQALLKVLPLGQAAHRHLFSQ